MSHAFTEFKKNFGIYKAEFIDSSASDTLVIVMSPVTKLFLMNIKINAKCLYIADTKLFYYIRNPKSSCNQIRDFAHELGVKNLVFLGSSKGASGALVWSSYIDSPKNKFKTYCLAFSPRTKIYPENPQIVAPSYKKMIEATKSSPRFKSELEAHGDIENLVLKNSKVPIRIVYPELSPLDKTDALRLNASNISHHAVPFGFHACITAFTIERDNEEEFNKTVDKIFANSVKDKDLEVYLKGITKPELSKQLMEFKYPSLNDYIFDFIKTSDENMKQVPVPAIATIESEFQNDEVKHAFEELQQGVKQYYSSLFIDNAESDILFIIMSPFARFILLKAGFTAKNLYLADKGLCYYVRNPMSSTAYIRDFAHKLGVRKVVFIGSSKGAAGALLWSSCIKSKTNKFTTYCMSFSAQSQLYPLNPGLNIPSYKKIMANLDKFPAVKKEMEEYGQIYKKVAEAGVKTRVVYPEFSEMDRTEALRVKGKNVSYEAVPFAFHGSVTPFVIDRKNKAAFDKVVDKLYADAEKDADMKQSLTGYSKKDLAESLRNYNAPPLNDYIMEFIEESGQASKKASVFDISQEFSGRNFIFEEHPESNKLLIFFSSRSAKRPEGVSQFKDYKINKLFIRDDNKGWYNNSISGISDDADHLVEKLKRIISVFGKENVTVSGCSMGGYAALLFGSLTGAGKVVAVAPQVKMAPGIPLCPTEKVKYENVAEVLKNADGTSEVEVWFGAESITDVYHGLTCKDLPSVKLFPVKNAMHNLLFSFKLEGRREEFIKYLAGE